MDEIQKSLIRLRHWIDHNKDHLDGYVQVADLLEQNNQRAASEKLKEAVKLVEQTNKIFEDVIALLPHAEAHESGHSHESHKHEHEHGHAHGHGRPHAHDHKD
jgi:Na+/phosphate symporter